MVVAKYSLVCCAISRRNVSRYVASFWGLSILLLLLHIIMKRIVVWYTSAKLGLTFVVELFFPSNQKSWSQSLNSQLMYYDSTELGAAMLELVRVRMKCRGPSAPPHHTQHLMIVGHKILIIRNFLDENWMLDSSNCCQFFSTAPNNNNKVLLYASFYYGGLGKVCGEIGSKSEIS